MLEGMGGPNNPLCDRLNKHPYHWAPTTRDTGSQELSTACLFVCLLGWGGLTNKQATTTFKLRGRVVVMGPPNTAVSLLFRNEG